MSNKRVEFTNHQGDFGDQSTHVRDQTTQFVERQLLLLIRSPRHAFLQAREGTLPWLRGTLQSAKVRHSESEVHVSRKFTPQTSLEVQRRADGILQRASSVRCTTAHRTSIRCAEDSLSIYKRVPRKPTSGAKAVFSAGILSAGTRDRRNNALQEWPLLSPDGEAGAVNAIAPDGTYMKANEESEN